MDSLIDFLPRWLNITIYVMSWLLVVLPIIFMPRRLRLWIGKKRWGTPNLISLYRLPLCYISYVIYFILEYRYVGFVLISLSFALDRLDGQVARALNELGDPRYPGSTPRGEWLDPLIDKLTLPVMMGIVAYIGYFAWSLMIPLLFFEIIGTLIRPPLNSWWGFIGAKPKLHKAATRSEKLRTVGKAGVINLCWPIRLLIARVRTPKATGVGKIKVIMQVISIACCMPLHHHWFSYSSVWVNVILSVVTLTGGLSVLSRLRLQKTMDRAVDWTTAFFNYG